MTTENTNTNPDNQNNDNQNIDPTIVSKDQDMIAKLVQDKLDENLKPIKDKLDSAYTQRDEALAKIAAYEQKEKDENLKRLQEEGKHKEAYELQIAEEKAKSSALEKKNIELTRDLSVRDALKSLPFRNDAASEMAYREVVGQMMQDAKGDWVHRSGISIRDFVKTFAESEEQSFLFKAKESSGGGSTITKTSGSSTEQKSLFSMSQAEVLALASAGKLPNQK